MIDSATIEKIKGAADILDVVGEFVTLRKSGANYKGLCPFHDEKTPSFVVSPARGTCHCFGCGKGGNPVGFIMEHEQLTYPEALKWLARKYGIEVRERELSGEEKRQERARQSMFIVNEWAAGYFSMLLREDPAGRAVGMQYFRERGFRDDVVEKFQLGYDLPDRHALAAAAKAKGYNTDYLKATGLCYGNDRGELIDRFAGRVVFPWVGVSGKVVGFGGRLLDSRTKGVAQKYVNSPDSDIYHKDRELYGIYQAKKAIAKEDRVFMVEGYTDVVAMHQCGIENVVANSGTALSVHQVRMLRRFTYNVVLLYDGDEAGIHAAMRGTDMMLAEGMNIKVVVLPGGEDPDSFARKHTAADFRRHMEESQADFIQFKTDLLLKGVTDPVKRTEAVNSILKSVSVVPDPILRATYLHECSYRLGLPESTLVNSMNRLIGNSKGAKQSAPAQGVLPTRTESREGKDRTLELMIARMVVKHGTEVVAENVDNGDGSAGDLTVARYIQLSMQADGLELQDRACRTILEEAAAKHPGEGFSTEGYFVHHSDIEVSQAATKLAEDSVQLCKSLQPTYDREKLLQDAEHLMYDFKRQYVERRVAAIKDEMAKTADPAERMRLMKEYKEACDLRNSIAKKVGGSVIT